MGKARKKTVPDGTIAATVLQAANSQREERKKRKHEDNSTSTSEPPAKKANPDNKKKEAFKPKEERKSKEQIKIIIAAKQKRIEKKDNKAREARDKLDSHPYLQSIEYLREWKNDRDNWGFKKVRQVWLLQHIYHETQVSTGGQAICLKDTLLPDKNEFSNIFAMNKTIFLSSWCIRMYIRGICLPLTCSA